MDPWRAEIYPPPSGQSLWRPVEAAYGIAGCCRSASPCPTPRASMMSGAHTYAQPSTHVSHVVAAALRYFLLFVCRLSHEAVLDS